MIDVSTKPVKVVISAPNENEGVDISDLVVGFDWGEDWLDQTGLAKCTGNLLCNGYPIGSSIDTNPRTNRIRWARGNKVEIWLNFGTGLELFKTLYILKEPLPPHPGNPQLQIPVGCQLALLDYRQPPQDASGVSLGTDTSRGAIAASILAKAGITFNGSIPGILKAPAQKLGNGSLVAQAGQVAFAGVRALACNSDGEVIAHEIDLDPDPFLSLRVGGWDGDELSYEPHEGQEPPAEIVRCTGVAYEVERPGENGEDSDENSTLKEEWGPASIVVPDASGPALLSQEFVTDTWDENQRTIRTLRNEPVGLVFPEDEPADPFALISVLETREIQTYEPGDEGKLVLIEIFSRAPFGVVAKEWIEGFNQPALKYEWTDVQYERKTYEYEQGETRREDLETWETLAAIAPTVQWIAPKTLQPSKLYRQSWSSPYRGEYKYTTETYESLSRAFPELAQNPTDPNNNPQALIGLLRTDNQSETSNSGQTQSPAPNRRRPEFTTAERQIEGVAKFAPYAGSEFQERERTYDIPYCSSEGELANIANLLGRILQGRRLGVEWALPLTSAWKDAPPFVRIDFTEPNGSIQSYLCNGISVSYESDRLYVGGVGIWRGEIREGRLLRPAEGHPTQKDYMVIGPDPVDQNYDLIQYTQPPVTKVFASAGGIGMGGRSRLYPYSLEQTVAASKGGMGMGGNALLDQSSNALFMRGGIGMGGTASAVAPTPPTDAEILANELIAAVEDSGAPAGSGANYWDILLIDNLDSQTGVIENLGSLTGSWAIASEGGAAAWTLSTLNGRQGINLGSYDSIATFNQSAHESDIWTNFLMVRAPAVNEANDLLSMSFTGGANNNDATSSLQMYRLFRNNTSFLAVLKSINSSTNSSITIGSRPNNKDYLLVHRWTSNNTHQLSVDGVNSSLISGATAVPSGHTATRIGRYPSTASSLTFAVNMIYYGICLCKWELNSDSIARVKAAINTYYQTTLP